MRGARARANCEPLDRLHPLTPGAGDGSRHSVGFLADVLHRIFACALAPAASLRTNAAMLVHLRVVLAFLGTPTARERAGLQHGLQHGFVRTGAARCQFPRRQTRVRAILVQANTLLELGDCAFRQTRISTTDARLCTRQTFLDAAHERVADIAPDVWMSTDHLLGVHREVLLGVAQGELCALWRVPKMSEEILEVLEVWRQLQISNRFEVPWSVPSTTAVGLGHARTA